MNFSKNSCIMVVLTRNIINGNSFFAALMGGSASKQLFQYVIGSTRVVHFGWRNIYEP